MYIVFESRSGTDSGSDYGRSRYVRENFDCTALGVFFGLGAANSFAKEHVESVHGYGDEDEDEDAEDEDNVEPYMWDNSDSAEEDTFDSVWVEMQAVLDATPAFRK